MTITCEVRGLQGEPYEGILVILCCVEDPRALFQARTDSDGHILVWNPVAQDEGPKKPLCVSGNNSNWHIKFIFDQPRTEPPSPERVAIRYINKFIFVKRNSEHNVCLYIDQETYCISDETMTTTHPLTPCPIAQLPRPPPPVLSKAPPPQLPKLLPSNILPPAPPSVAATKIGAPSSRKTGIKRKRDSHDSQGVEPKVRRSARLNQ